MSIEKICSDLYRILIPFEDIFTTVYVVLSKEKATIIDSGACASDVDLCILPALKEIGIQKNNVRYLLLTHSHSDHAGGIGRLTKHFPEAELKAFYEIALPHFSLLKDNEKILLTDLLTISLPGHTADAGGFVHLPSGTLLSGDCLQLKGIGKYRNNIADRKAYERSVEKLKKLKLNRIVAAHEFDPLGSVADGAKNVQVYLDMCMKM